ncbi:MAG: superinfection immunity protein [Candidatus Acidiferrales bacterium]
MTDNSGGWILLLLSLVIYFIPSMWAASKHSNKSTGIFLLNLLLGWTVIGWIGALIWAGSVESDTAKTAKVAVAPLMKKCPQCAEVVLQDARICRFCHFDFTPNPQLPEEPR